MASYSSFIKTPNKERLNWARSVRVCSTAPCSDYVTRSVSKVKYETWKTPVAISKVILCISRFNVDCSASSGLYGAVEGAFGLSAGAGGHEAGEVSQCPAPGPASLENCAGAVSNCWSPGQRDTGWCWHFTTWHYVSLKTLLILLYFQIVPLMDCAVLTAVQTRVWIFPSRLLRPPHLARPRSRLSP